MTGTKGRQPPEVVVPAGGEGVEDWGAEWSRTEAQSMRVTMHGLVWAAGKIL